VWVDRSNDSDENPMIRLQVFADDFQDMLAVRLTGKRNVEIFPPSGQAGWASRSGTSRRRSTAVVERRLALLLLVVPT
jgi:hypothetical protein